MAQLTYTTLEGDVLDLISLAANERAFLDSMIAGYQAGAAWGDFARRVSGDENPALEPGRRLSRAVVDSPLYRAVRDMEDRLAIAQGILRPGKIDDPSMEPFADEFLGAYDAARELGITARAVYNAIGRGELIATKERPARVSRRSVERYQVSPRHVKAGKRRRDVA